MSSRSHVMLQPSQPAWASLLDHSNIVALSLACAEDLDVTVREMTALAMLPADLDMMTMMQHDAGIDRMRREVDSAVVHTMETVSLLQALCGSSKVAAAVVASTRLEYEYLAVEVEHLQRDLMEANASCAMECLEVEKLKQLFLTYRKEIGAEAKLWQ